MRRGAPLARKTPMKRSWMKRGKKRTKYARRERNVEHMLAVKDMPCAAAGLSPCFGPIEADHASSGALSNKSDDETVIPMCAGHHRCRTDFSGPFKNWDKAMMRAFMIAAQYRARLTISLKLEKT